MKPLILIAVIFLCACAKPIKHIEPEFQGTYDSFILESIKYGRDVSATNNIIIERGETASICDNGKVTACCKLNGHGQAHIIVDNSELFYSEAAREKILFHELGHCLLNKDHDNSLDENGRPAKIMSHNIRDLPEYFYQQNRDHYVSELFAYGGEK